MMRVKKGIARIGFSFLLIFCLLFSVITSMNTVAKAQTPSDQRLTPTVLNYPSSDETLPTDERLDSSLTATDQQIDSSTDPRKVLPPSAGQNCWRLNSSNMVQPQPTNPPTPFFYAPFETLWTGTFWSATMDHSYPNYKKMGGLSTLGENLTDLLGSYGTFDFYYSPIFEIKLAYDGHDGNDFATTGHALSVARGEVIREVSLNKSYGNYIDIYFENEGYLARYAHLDSFAQGISVGSKVEPGTILGTIGTTGNSTGIHLHFSVYRWNSIENGWEITDPFGWDPWLSPGQQGADPLLSCNGEISYNLWIGGWPQLSSNNSSTSALPNIKNLGGWFGDDVEVNNPLPEISSINPNSVNKGSGNQTITVNGSNFINDSSSHSTITWNGEELTTSFVSASLLTATIPASKLVTQGVASVAVLNTGLDGRTSNSVNFTINQITDGCYYVDDLGFNPASPSNATDIKIHTKIKTTFPNYRAARLKIEGGDSLGEFSSYEDSRNWHTTSTSDGSQTITLEIDDNQGASWDSPLKCSRPYYLNSRAQPTLGSFNPKSPLNEATIPSSNIIHFQWEFSSGAQNYRVHLWNSSGFDYTTPFMAESENSWDYVAQNSGTYYWQVEATKPNYQTQKSSIWSFTITPKANVPTFTIRPLAGNNYSVGQHIYFNVEVDTAGRNANLNSTDVSIEYDNTRLRLVNINNVANAESAGIFNGKIGFSYPAWSTCGTNAGLLAVLDFEVIAGGSTALTFNWSGPKMWNDFNNLSPCWDNPDQSDMLENIVNADFVLTGPPPSVPAPILSSLSETYSPIRLSDDYWIYANGSEFYTSSIVKVNGVETETHYYENGKLSFKLNSEVISTPGDYSVTVYTPGGGTSTPLIFTVLPPVDTISPDLNWVTPTSNQQVIDVADQTLELSVSATDNVGVDYVEFFRWDAENLEFVQIGISHSSPYTVMVDTSVLNEGWNNIFAAAYDSSGNSSEWKYIWINYIIPPSIPNTPQNFLQSSSTGNGITLSWQDNSRNEKGFNIYKWDWYGNFYYYDSVGKGVTSFTDSDVPCGQDQYYELSAFNDMGESDHTVWQKGTSAACPVGINDNLDSPTFITTSPVLKTMSTTKATYATDDPAFWSCNRKPGKATVWYKYIAPTGGVLSLTTVGSTYDTILGVWTGERGNLLLKGCNDDRRPGDLQSDLTINLIKGTEYYIEVAEYNGNLSSGEAGQSLDSNDEEGIQTPQEGIIYQPSQRSDNSTKSVAKSDPILNADVAASGGNLLLNLKFSSNCKSLTFSHTGSGTNPVPSPIKSNECSANYSYVSGQVISLTASPSSGYRISSWSGTSNNSSTSTTNMVKMGPSVITVSVNYTNKPSSPALVSPINSVLLTSLTPTLNWGTTLLPLGTKFSKYEVQLSKSSTFSSLVFDKFTASGNSAAHSFKIGASGTSALTSATRYYWRARTLLTNGTVGPWSSTGVFLTTVKNPTLVSPSNGASMKGSSVTFKWKAVVVGSGTVSYSIQYSTSSTFSTSTTVNVTGISKTFNLPKNGKYYWRIKAISSIYGTSTWSSVRSFYYTK